MAPPPLKKWRIVARKHLSHDVIELQIARNEGISFRAGQYMSIVIPGAGPGGRNLRRAYSIASPPEWSHIELCIKVVPNGPGTTYLNQLQVGDEIEAQLPFGDFVLDHDPNAPVLFIATGTGVAPHRSMILSKQWQHNGPVGFLMGVRHDIDIIYPELFHASRPTPLQTSKHVAVCLTQPSTPASGFHGRVTDYLRKLAKDATAWDFGASHYYLCGNGAMISEVKNYLMGEMGVVKEKIHTEKYY